MVETTDRGWLETAFAESFVPWARQVGLSGKLAFALAVATFASGMATYTAWTGTALETPNPRVVLILLIIDLVLVLSLGAFACAPADDTAAADDGGAHTAGDTATADGSSTGSTTGSSNSATASALADADGQATNGSRGRTAVRGGRDAQPETLVVVESLRIGPVRDEVVVSSRVESRRSMSVFPKLPNLPISDILVEEGDRVAEGDVLMRLYDTDLKLAEQTAATLRDQAVKEVAKRRLALEGEDTKVQRAQRQATKARADLDRLAEIGDQGLVTRKEVDDARLAAETAEDDLLLAQFNLRNAALELELAEIASDRARLDWQKASTDLTHSLVRAAMSGVIAERHCEVGELSGTSQYAFRLVDTDALILNLRVPQDALGEIAAGQPVDVRAVTDLDKRFTGRVRTVNDVLDPDSGSVRVIVDLDPGAGLVPGLFCEARVITSARDDALLVSKRAVLYEDDQPVIFAVAEAGAARKIPFVAGVSTSSAVEIISDLAGAPLPGDLRVVVVGQENLQDGAPVRIVEDAF